jgi:hypothetical protein
MLRIRPEQMHVFEQVCVTHLVERFMAYLPLNFPDFCAAAGEPAVERETRDAIRRAQAYGFTSANDICKFLNLHVVLGRDFDKLPDNAWMREWLNPFDELHSSVRMRSLYRETIVRLRLQQRLAEME